jgi:hypothetical protein
VSQVQRSIFNPFANPDMASGYEAWYESTGRRADHLEKNWGHGPVIVNLRGTRVALGRGEASKILVDRLEGGDNGR